MRIALECQQRGHQIRVYTLIWEGDIPEGFDVRIGPIKAFSNHRRNTKFYHWLQADMQQQPVARVIGFNKMPGLDVYYAADGCYEDKAQTLRNPCTDSVIVTVTLLAMSVRYLHLSHPHRF